MGRGVFVFDEELPLPARQRPYSKGSGMDAPPAGFLRRPSGHGLVAPHPVRDVVDATQSICGDDARARLTGEAGLTRMPAFDHPVSEVVAARLHQGVRRLFPAQAQAVLWMAGQTSADRLMTHQLSARAQTLLSSAAWPIAAWFVGKWARQNDWAFAGSGRFVVLSAMEFEISDNPLIRGEAQSTAPVCHYHAALFERLFQRLVDPRLICREMICAAAGGSACRFDFYLAPDADDPA